MMPKKIKIFLIVALMGTISLGYCAPIALAADNQPVNIYLFWTKGCPHCALEKEFLAKLAGQDRQLKIVTFELTGSRENRELFQKVGEELRANVSGVPFTVVGERFVIGWLDEASTGAFIVQAVSEARRTGTPDVVARLQAPPVPAVPMDQKAVPEKLPVPFFGEIDLKHLSLGLITLIIGLLDGFNP